MKKLINVFFAVFLGIAVIGQSLHGAQAQTEDAETIKQAMEMVKNTAPEELDVVIAQEKQKIEAPDELHLPAKVVRGLMDRLAPIVTVPVDYVFGEEDSSAKKAFYGAMYLCVIVGWAFSKPGE